MNVQKISWWFLGILLISAYVFAQDDVLKNPTDDELYQVITTGDTGKMQSFINNGQVASDKMLMNSMNTEMSMLHVAIQARQTGMVHLLLHKLYVDPNLITSNYPIPPLYDAVIRDNLAIIKLLVNAQADLNYIDESTNRSLLDFANDLPVIAFLLQHKVNPNTQDSTTGNTPLFQACFDEQFDKANLLLQYKADPKILNKFQESPLHALAALDSQNSDSNKKEQIFSLTKRIFNLGVNPMIKDIDGNTAIRIAFNNQNIDMQRLLLTYSAFTMHGIQEQSLFKSTLLHAVQEYYKGKQEFLSNIIKNKSASLNLKLQQYLKPYFLSLVEKEFNG